MFLKKLILLRTIWSANAALVNQCLGVVAELDEKASQLRVDEHDANALSSAGRSSGSLPSFLPHQRQCPWLLTRQLHLGSHLTFSVHTMALPLISPGCVVPLRGNSTSSCSLTAPRPQQRRSSPSRLPVPFHAFWPANCQVDLLSSHQCSATKAIECCDLTRA